MKQSALIGMSGGVDSSVAAYLAQQQGYRCIGATMKLYENEIQDGRCGNSDDAADAQAVAHRLGIPHYTFAYKEEFQRHIMQDFVTCYERGLTPNPCIRCNKIMKFGVLLQQAMALGCGYVVSGHYAQIRQDKETGRFLLYKAMDRSKDQTYFLASLDQTQLSHILFPLGSLTKAEVRQIAQDNGFINARKRDSQDICFVPDGDYGTFLERFTGKTYPRGDFLDLNGKIVGQHNGAVRYTLGQRKGLGIALGAPVYVCGKDMLRNTVTVGPNDALFSRGLLAEDWHWHPFPSLSAPMEVTAKIRHSQVEHPAMVYPEGSGFARVEFTQPQRAVTPGQAVVLYQGDLVIGGGTITKALQE